MEGGRGIYYYEKLYGDGVWVMVWWVEFYFGVNCFAPL